MAYHNEDIAACMNDNCPKNQSDDGILEHKCAINAVKELYEQKPAWSEEDNEKLLSAIEHLKDCDFIHRGYTPNNIVTWLKSLKERVQPQNTWKPSEEQMGELQKVINKGWFNPYVINSLYQDLKAL